ncbi:MAG: tetratricopeptide repeat protein [Hyphomicrobium sp.]
MAADKQHAWGLFNLGSLMLAGDGVERNGRGALALFVRAARLGNAKAMTMIGQHREEGSGTPKDLAAALRWYRRAAERGCFRGQYNLARFLARAGDFESAAHWVRACCATAPAAFCRDVGLSLIAHQEPCLQSAGREVLARAASV